MESALIVEKKFSVFGNKFFHYSILSGIISIVSQTILFRELFALTYGNELYFSLFLFIWLISVAAGARLVAPRKGRSAVILGALSFIVPASYIMQVVLGSLSSLYLGNVLGFTPLMGLSILTVIPVGFFIGGFFPSCSYELSSCFVGNKMRYVYGGEAIGAIAGIGVFYLLIAHMSHLMLLAAVSLIAITVIFLYERKWLYVFIGLAIIAATMIGSNTISHMLGFRYASDKIFIQQSTEGVLVKTNNAVFYNGRYIPQRKNSLNAEKMLFLIKCFNLAPENILIVNYPVSGFSNIVCRYLPDTRVIIPQLDPNLADLMKEKSFCNSEIINKPHVQALMKYKELDFVIAEPYLPATIAENSLYSKEYFKIIRNSLKPNGVFICSLPFGSRFYSDEEKAIIGILNVTLRSVFPVVKVNISDDNIYFLASCTNQNLADMNGGNLLEKFDQLNYSFDYLTRQNIYEDFYSFNINKQDLTDDINNNCFPVNSSIRPVIYNKAIIYLNKLFEGGGITAVRLIIQIAVALLLLMVIILFLKSKKHSAQSGQLLVFNGSFSAIIIELLIMIKLQMEFGNLYGLVVLVFGLFMLGLSLGALLNLRKLPIFIGPGSILLITILMYAFHINAPGWLFLFLNLLSGLVCGANFQLGVRAAKGQNLIELYITDTLAGAFGVLLPVSFLLPNLGSRNTIFVILGINIFVLGYGVFFRNRLEIL